MVVISIRLVNARDCIDQHFSGAVVREVLLYSLSHLGFISVDHYEESEGSEDQSLALNYEGR